MPLFEFQKKIIKTDKIVVCAPRQIGKTHSLCVRQAVDKNDVIITSNNVDNAKKILRQYGEITGCRETQMYQPNFRNHRVDVMSSDPNSIPGRTASVIIDEFALHAAQTELIAQCAPVSVKTGRLAIVSTPRNRSSLFYEFIYGNQGKEAGYSIYNYNVYDLLDCYKIQLANIIKDSIDKDQAVIKYLKQVALTESNWKREFECKFDEDSSVLIPFDMVFKCYRGKLQHMPPNLTRNLSNVQLGIDVGRTNDNTVIYLSGLDNSGRFGEGEQIVSFELDSFTGKPFSDIRKVIESRIKTYKPTNVLIDAGGLGLNLQESLQEQHGSLITPIMFSSSPKDINISTQTKRLKSVPKQFLAENVRFLMESSAINIWSDSDVCGSVNSICKIYSKSGDHILYNGRYKEKHCDDFWQLSLSLYKLSKKFGEQQIVG